VAGIGGPFVDAPGTSAFTVLRGVRIEAAPVSQSCALRGLRERAHVTP